MDGAASILTGKDDREDEPDWDDPADARKRLSRSLRRWKMTQRWVGPETDIETWDANVALTRDTMLWEVAEEIAMWSHPGKRGNLRSTGVVLLLAKEQDVGRDNKGVARSVLWFKYV